MQVPSFPGTLSVIDATLIQALIEICDDLMKYGTTHILFVNGHGGNLTPIQRCGAVLRQRHVLMSVCSWWHFTHVVNPEWQCIGHGDHIETSVVLAVDESLPEMEIAKIPKQKNLSETIALDTPHAARFKNATMYVNLYTADLADSGDLLEYGLTAAKNYDIPPTAARQEIGDQILDGVADYLADFQRVPQGSIASRRQHRSTGQNDMAPAAADPLRRG